MNAFWHRWIVEPLDVFLREVGQFLPRLIIFFFLVALGFALGYVLKGFLVWLLGKARLDEVSRKTGTSALLQRVGLKDPPARLTGKLAFGLCVLVFCILGLGSLDVQAAQGLLQRFFLYLPNVFVAGFVLLVGYVLAAFLARAALITAVNAGWKTAAWIAKGVQAAVLFFVSTMALEQLGIGRQTILTAFAILFGGAVLALALAFGLGGKDVAREILEKRFRPSGPVEKDDLKHM